MNESNADERPCSSGGTTCEGRQIFFSRNPDRGRQFTSTAVFIGLLSSLAAGGMAWFLLPFALRAQLPPAVAAARVFLLIGGIYAVVGIPHGSLRGDHSFTA